MEKTKNRAPRTHLIYCCKTQQRLVFCKSNKLAIATDTGAIYC